MVTPYVQTKGGHSVAFRIEKKTGWIARVNGAVAVFTVREDTGKSSKEMSRGVFRKRFDMQGKMFKLNALAT